MSNQSLIKRKKLFIMVNSYKNIIDAFSNFKMIKNQIFKEKLLPKYSKQTYGLAITLIFVSLTVCTVFLSKFVKNV